MSTMPSSLCDSCQCELDCDDARMCEACQASWRDAPHWFPCPDCGCSVYAGDTIGACTCCPCPHQSQEIVD